MSNLTPHTRWEVNAALELIYKLRLTRFKYYVLGEQDKDIERVFGRKDPVAKIDNDNWLFMEVYA